MTCELLARHIFWLDIATARRWADGQYVLSGLRGGSVVV